MEKDRIKKLLEDVKAGACRVEDAIETLRHLPFEDVGFAKIDHHRELRCGWPEVIFCEGKKLTEVVKIVDAIMDKSGRVLATRAAPEVFEAVRETFSGAVYEERARIVKIGEFPKQAQRGTIAVVTAGTADIPVAEEARVTAGCMGNDVSALYDVGVAGIHRLLGSVESLRGASVVVVVAGMEGALASVVGGIVDVPVIAVPTSVGYGASFGGIAPLLTMMNSCAPGVTVVNIDNGFGAGFVASLINLKKET